MPPASDVGVIHWNKSLITSEWMQVPVTVHNPGAADLIDRIKKTISARSTDTHKLRFVSLIKRRGEGVPKSANFVACIHRECL